MKPVLVGFLAMVAGCGDPGGDPGSDPNSIALDRQYVLSSCLPASCATYQPHGTGKVDSARLVLRPDHTAAWMYASSGTVNPCYTQNRDCSVPYNEVYRTAGQYSFSADTLRLNLETFAADIPKRVAPDWSGPASFTTSPSLHPEYSVTVRSP